MTWSIDRSQEAPLSPSSVFALYTDPTTWADWGHNTRRAWSDGPIVEGATINVEAGYRRTWEVLVS